MEVASMQQQREAPNGAPPADTSMDIDMDLDLGPLPEPEPIEAEPATTAAPDGVVDNQTAEEQPEKVHIRGVDELTTDNIKQFATGHFPAEEPTRVEWIDDTSANIVYSSPEAGAQALSAFTQIGEEEDMSALPALRLRSAKLLPTHPDSVLQVRTAVKTDRKKPRAHEASRFYLMHPEHDPREKLRLELADRRRQGGDSSEGDYRRRQFDGRELRRRRDRDNDELISADMYDDSTGAELSGRRGQGSRELFPDEGRSSGRLRNRSASPGRDTLESDRLDSDRYDRRFRERSPQLDRRNKGKELLNKGKELFPSESDSRELFPNKTTTSYLKKELFPSKISNHRRTDAIDGADETLSSRISAPSHDQGQNRNVELFPDSSDRSGVNIRGTAHNEGFSVRGAANGMSIKGRGASVRELFPSTYSSNAGKELFSNKIEGRGGPRRRAEDMFG